MPITHNLGRINKCKIVGCKDRFIEVRCGEAPCTENCFECIDGNCIGQVGGQFNTMADCMANPLVNSCVTAGMTNTGVLGSMTGQYTYLAANGHHAVSMNTFYFEDISVPCNTATSCHGPNGGCFIILNTLQVRDAASTIVYTATMIDDLVTYLATQGITILPTDDYYTVRNAVQNSSGPLSHGNISLTGSPCNCTGCGSGPGASWECYEDAGGSYCDDPLDGSGQYPTEADCLAALASGTNSTCDVNGAASGPGAPITLARVNGAPGTIFSSADAAAEYYGDPANGISGVNAGSLFFEIVESGYCANLMPPNEPCCPGPNSTTLNPTVTISISQFSIMNVMWQGSLGSGGNTTSCCVAHVIDGISPTMYPGWLSGTEPGTSIFGMGYGSSVALPSGAPANLAYWTYDEILVQCMAAGITGVTMSTPIGPSGNPNNLQELTNTWLQAGGWPSHPCHGNNSCLASGVLNAGVSFTQAFYFHDWMAANHPTLPYNTYFWEWTSSFTPPSSACLAPSGDAYNKTNNISVRNSAQVILMQITGGTDALALAITTYPGSNITANGSMTIATLEGLMNTTPGSLYQGDLLAASSYCQCSAPTDIRCNDGTGTLPASPLLPAVCQVHFCNTTRHCTCEEACENITYDCDPLTCVCYDPGNGLGAYTGPTALNDCIQNCCSIRAMESWDCNRDGNCYDPGNGSGQYTDANSGGNPGDGLIACQTALPVNTCSTLTVDPSGVVYSNMTQWLYGYYTVLANAISNLSMATFKVQTTSSNCDNNPTANCCRVPGTAVGPPGTWYWQPLKILFGWYPKGCCPGCPGCPGTGCRGCECYLGPGTPNSAIQFPGLSSIHYDTWADVLAEVATTLPAIGIVLGDDLTSFINKIEAYYNNLWYPTGLSSVHLHVCIDDVQCSCSECRDPQGSSSGEGQWECYPTSGCIPDSNGQYSSWGQCDQSNAIINTCDNLLYMDPVISGAPTLWDNIVNDTTNVTVSGSVTGNDITNYFTYLLATPDNKCLPPGDPNICPQIVDSSGNPQVRFGEYIVWNPSTGLPLSGWQASYPTWDSLLVAAIFNVGAPITSTSDFNTVKSAVEAFYGIGKGDIAQYYTCCRCSEGCGEVEPQGRGSCLVLHLDATDTSSVTLQSSSTSTTMPQVDQAMNKAYNGIGLPLNNTAYYTWDTIDNVPTSAPFYDTTTFSFPTFLFTNKDGIYKYLIANENGPQPPTLQYGTTHEIGYGYGWTIFFHRLTTATEWINSKTWFMGDDLTVSHPATKHMASGLRPHGQPYCESNYYGQMCTKPNASYSHYEASPLNEYINTGDRTLKTNEWYVHWIVATEQLPSGNGIFDVIWGVGSEIQFKDTIVTDGNPLDMVLANINTRNRGQDGFIPGRGWYSEIRAYDCAFDDQQIQTEISEIETKYGYGTLATPSPLPPGCGEAFKSIHLDGNNLTHLAVQNSGVIVPSTSGFTASGWFKVGSCDEFGHDNKLCFFEKGLNTPSNNEDVAFRLLLEDSGGKLYWDVFGDSPRDYLLNFSRVESTVTWLGAADCASMIGEWHHITVTGEGLNCRNKKIYLDGVDVTAVQSPIWDVTGRVKRDTNYTLNIGDSSRDLYTFNGNLGQFITWNTKLSTEEVLQVYSNGEYFNPLNDIIASADSPYAQSEYITFYTDMDSEEVIDRSTNHLTTIKYGGVNFDTGTDTVVNAGLPTDIPGLELWLKAGTRMLSDQDHQNNTISRADYMIGNPLHMGDKLALWECSGGSGKYVAQTTTAYKPKYECMVDVTAVPTVTPLGKAIYTDSSDRLQIFHTHTDGGINIPAADGINGAFTMMFRVKLEDATVSTESFCGDTSNNYFRMETASQFRIKMGGGSNKNFTIPSGGVVTNTDTYIFTVNRYATGALQVYIDGGVYSNVKLDNTHTETNAGTIDHIIGIPGQGMKGWFFDFMFFKDTTIEGLSDDQRKAMQRVMREEVRTLS